MSTRRIFIKITGIASAALGIGVTAIAGTNRASFTSMRPELAKRKFISKVVEDTIIEVKRVIACEELAWMFENCFPNTLVRRKKWQTVYCLKTLRNTHVGTVFIHESFHVDNPNDFSRSWFAWANTIFGELVLKLYKERPKLLKQKLG